MTREEAIRALERADGYVGIHYINGVEEAYINPHLREAVKVALTALRGPTRETGNEFGKCKKFKEYFDDLYGKGLEVENWHMNGETIPFDDFYESACEYAEL